MTHYPLSGISRVALVLLLCLPMAKTTLAQESPQPKAEATEIEKRLSVVESELGKLRSVLDLSKSEFESYMTRLTDIKSELSTIQQSIIDSQVALSGDRMALSENQFNIFLAMLAVGALLAGLGGLVIRQQVTERAVKDAQTRLNDMVDLRVKDAMSLTLTEGLARLAFAWWEIYDPHLQKMLRTKKGVDVDPLQLHLATARAISDEASDIFKKKPQIRERMKEDHWIFATYHRISNLYVYTRTAELAFDQLENGKTPSEKAKDDLLDRAELCLRLARDPRAHRTTWYELQQTATFAILWFGDQTAQARARKIIQNLFSGKSPKDFDPPPKDWLQRVFDEYCPADENGNPTDPWSLEITRPA